LGLPAAPRCPILGTGCFRQPVCCPAPRCGCLMRGSEAPTIGNWSATFRGAAHHLKRPLAALLLFAASARCSQGNAAEQFLEVSVEIEAWTYALGDEVSNTIEHSNSFPVKCVLGAARWWVETHFVPNAVKTYYYDGRNVYSATAAVGSWPESVRKANSVRRTPYAEPSELSKSINWITISPTSDPAGDFGINLPWLAFCSGAYLRQVDRVIPLPATMSRSMRDSYAYRDETRTFEDPLGLPELVKLFYSSNLFERSLQDPRLSREALRRATPDLPEGALKFEYRVESATNILGWTLPRTFRFTQYDIDQRGRWRTRYEGKGRSRSFVPAAEPRNIFVSDKRQVVTDYRFHMDRPRVDFINYEWSNAVPPQTNDQRLRALFKEAQALTPTEPKKPALRVVQLALACVAISVPVSLAAREFQRAKRSKLTP
jgi:hypothetical protein